MTLHDAHYSFDDVRTMIGLVMAGFIPAPIAIVRNALLMPRRGTAVRKLMFEAPHRRNGL